MRLINTAATIAALSIALTGCGLTHAGDSPGFPPVGTETVTSESMAPVGIAPEAPGTCAVVDGRADRRCTPGITNPAVTQADIRTTICVSGYTATIRPPVSYTNLLKARQMRSYGEVGKPADFEEDHLLALEDGGDPRDPRNLFPQPRTGARPASMKDHQENMIHAAICSPEGAPGHLTLAQGQAELLANWTH